MVKKRPNSKILLIIQKLQVMPFSDICSKISSIDDVTSGFGPQHDLKLKNTVQSQLWATGSPCNKPTQTCRLHDAVAQHPYFDIQLRSRWRFLIFEFYLNSKKIEFQFHNIAFLMPKMLIFSGTWLVICPFLGFRGQGIQICKNGLRQKIQYGGNPRWLPKWRPKWILC